MSGFAPFGEGLRDARRHWTRRVTLASMHRGQHLHLHWHHRDLDVEDRDRLT